MRPKLGIRKKNIGKILIEKGNSMRNNSDPINMKYQYSVYTCFALMFIFVSALEASIGVSLHIDRTEVTQSDTIKMTIKLQGTQSAINPKVGGLQNFRVESGGTSSNFSMVNGQVSSSIDQTYYLYPKRVGKFTIGPAYVAINGKNYQSNTVSITVKKQSADAAQQSHQPVFVTVSVSDKNAFVGQTIFYTVKFYYSVAVRDLGIVLPEGDGFLLKQVSKPREYNSNVKGKQYKVIEIRHALTTEKTGVFKIAPTVMKMQILQKQQSRNRFSVFDGFFTSARPYSTQSQAVELKISHLPDKNQPSDFTGLVGEFTIQANLDPKKVKSGESTTLSVQISGKGNVQLMPDITMPEMDHIKVYADKPEISIKETSDGFSGKKSMKWALVPQREGNYTIGPFKLSYFSPKQRQYKTISTQTIQMTVTPGDKPEPEAPSIGTDQSLPQVKKEVTFFQRDILPVHDHSDALAVSSYYKLSDMHRLLMFAFPPFIYLIIVGVFYRKTRLKIEKMNAKKALQQLNKALTRQQERLDNAEMLKLFHQFLSIRLQRTGGALSPDEILKILMDSGVDEALAQETRSMLSNMEAAVYTGRTEEDMTTLIQTIREMAKKLDKGIKS